MILYKMFRFRFTEKVFFVGLINLSVFTSVNSLSCISMNNQECKARPEIINVNSKKLMKQDI